jgi:hypothetical protein
MTPELQTQLNAIIERLEIVQAVAPAKTTFSMGRTESSMSVRLLDIIRDLKVLANDTTETDPARPAKSGK